MARTPTLKSLKAKLWKVTSQLIKQIYGKKCYTCDRQADGSGLHCGHFIPSSVCGISLRYNLRNLRPQCYNCNINLGGNGAEYYRRMVEEVGQEEVDKLFQEKNKITKWSLTDYQDLIDKYTKQCENQEI